MPKKITHNRTKHHRARSVMAVTTQEVEFLDLLDSLDAEGREFAKLLLQIRAGSSGGPMRNVSGSLCGWTAPRIGRSRNASSRCAPGRGATR